MKHNRSVRQELDYSKIDEKQNNFVKAKKGQNFSQNQSMFVRIGFGLIEIELKKYLEIQKLVSMERLHPSDIMEEDTALRISDTHILKAQRFNSPILKAVVSYLETCRLFFDAIHSFDPKHKSKI